LRNGDDAAAHLNILIGAPCTLIEALHAQRRRSRIFSFIQTIH
jgi:hypothetical protein